MNNAPVLDVQATLCSLVQTLTGGAVDPDQPLMDAGCAHVACWWKTLTTYDRLDSLGAVELRNMVASTFNCQVPATFVFDYPTVTAMTAFVAEQLGQSATELPASMPLHVSTEPSTSQRVAVVAVSSRLPGTPSFNADGVCPVPFSRWDVDQAMEGAPQRRFGAFLTASPYLFDPAAFGVAAQEAVLMDPQQRLLLEGVAEVHASGALSSDAGVYVGIAHPDYAELAKEFGGISSFSATGSAISVAAGRLSYVFGLQGPSVAMDTACSSSLVAATMALVDMRVGTCPVALVGGAWFDWLVVESSTYIPSSGTKLMLTPTTTAMFAKAGMLAYDGRCKTLDAAADGYVRGEACVVMALRACADGMLPEGTLAVFAGAASNQDARSSSLTAPNGRAQQAVMRAALRVADLQPDGVAMLQLHGTGTALGTRL